MSKQNFIAMACDSKLDAIILWPVITVKLNVHEKIAGLEINNTESQTSSMFLNL